MCAQNAERALAFEFLEHRARRAAARGGRRRYRVTETTSAGAAAVVRARGVSLSPTSASAVARVGVARVIADAGRGGRALPLAVAPRWRRAAAPLRAAERGATVQTTDYRGYFAVPVAVPYRNQRAG